LGKHNDGYGMGQKMAEQKLHLHDLRSWPTR
jgi:hypothetical protein